MTKYYTLNQIVAEQYIGGLSETEIEDIIYRIQDKFVGNKISTIEEYLTLKEKIEDYKDSLISQLLKKIGSLATVATVDITQLDFYFKDEMGSEMSECGRDGIDFICDYYEIQ